FPFFFFQAEDGIRDFHVTGVQTCALPILAQCELPLVSIDVPLPAPRATLVTIDNRRAMEEAVAYLAGLGHRRLAFVNGHMRAFVSQERLEGFRSGAAKAGLPVPEEWVVISDFTEPGGYRATWGLLRQPQRPTAVLYASDLMAIGRSEERRVGNACRDERWPG